MELSTGAELRITGPIGAHAAVVCVNGGQANEVEGTWSASLEWLVGRLAPRFPGLAFAEVRYRVKSWKRLDWCVEDARAAIATTAAGRTLLVGYSMGARLRHRPPASNRSRPSSVSLPGSLSASRSHRSGGAGFA